MVDQTRNKTSLDLFWLKDESLLDFDNLSNPNVIAATPQKPVCHVSSKLWLGGQASQDNNNNG